MEPDWRSPSPAMWRARRAEVVVAAVVLAGVGAAAVSNQGTAALVGVPVAVLVAGVAAGVLLFRRYRSWAYAERAEDLLIRRGVMIRRLTVVPYGRMQFVDVTAGPVDRLFGLATVQLHTASAASDARIPGLERPEADRLRDQLAGLGEAKATGL